MNKLNLTLPELPSLDTDAGEKLPPTADEKQQIKKRVVDQILAQMLPQQEDDDEWKKSERAEWLRYMLENKPMVCRKTAAHCV